MEEEKILNVTQLQVVDKLQNEDVILLIRDTGNGKQCFQIRGFDFRGESAYEAALSQGFEGTYADWQAEIGKTIQVSAAVDIATKATLAANTAANNANTAADAANKATLAANTAASNATKATEASKTQTALAKELNEHPQKQGDNGNWWKWNTTTKLYEDTGIPAKGGMLYPIMWIDGNALYLEDNESSAASHLSYDGNALYLVI